MLHMEQVSNMLNMRVFVDTDDDVRLARRCLLSPISVAVLGTKALHLLNLLSLAWLAVKMPGREGKHQDDVPASTCRASSCCGLGLPVS